MADYNQPTFVEKRVRYFQTQDLKDQDRIDEQKYHLDRLRRYSRALSVAGIVDGLAVTPGPNQVTVAPGTAIDGRGRQLVLGYEESVKDLSAYKGKTVDLVIAYRERPSDLADGQGTRFSERPWVGPLDKVPTDRAQALDPADALHLARLSVANDGAVTVDTSKREASGLRLAGGNLGDPTTWHMLRVHDGALHLTGNPPGAAKFRVDGALTVTGPSTLVGDVTLPGTAKLTVGGALSVTGASTLTGDVTLPGTAKLTVGGLEVAGGVRILSDANPLRFTSAWSNFPNEGGAVEEKRNHAEISNDTKDHQTLLIVGNRSKDKAVRRVSVWDRLEVKGNLLATALQIADPTTGQPYQANWIGMADNISDKIKWLHIGGITDGQGSSNKRRLALYADITYVPGNVGLGVVAPTDRLEVAGNLTVTGNVTVAGLSAAAGTEALRIVRGAGGRTEQRGKVGEEYNVGEGFTLVRTGVGLYNVRFADQFSGIPAGTVTLIDLSDRVPTDHVTIKNLTRENLRVKIGDVNGNALDRPFSFIVIGPR